ncbi:hypothetical protein M1O12_01240 [Dehalococcoidia bacterium]|nr:hypothetical protein [Dehalococcoidia bacterium]
MNRVKEDLYSALVVVTSSGETSFVEVIIEGERTEVRELEPILIDETLTEEIVIEEFKVENKHPAAPAKLLKQVAPEPTNSTSHRVRLSR